MGNQRNYYVLLGIPRNASQDEIRRAYLTAARRLHPDVNKDPNAGTVFLSIQQAYETLNNPEERAKYDKDQTFESEDSPIKINTIYSRPSLVQLDEPQLIYALIEIKPRKSRTEFNAPPLNLCLVLDRSTSMQGARLEIVKDTAIDLTQQLSPRDLLSIVTFSDNPEVLVPSGMLLDQRTIENRIRSLRAGGGTEIFRGMKAGYQELRKNLRPSYINHLILITDGRTYGDEEDCLDIATQSASIWESVFLDWVSEANGTMHFLIAWLPGQAELAFIFQA
jgi:Ca-activated chloride channel family protein